MVEALVDLAGEVVAFGFSAAFSAESSVDLLASAFLATSFTSAFSSLASDFSV